MPSITIHHLRAALRSPAHYKHELKATHQDCAFEFTGAKSCIAENPDALKALNGCQDRGTVLNGIIDGIECTTLIDARGEGAILRGITTPKDAQSASLQSFAALIQRLHLDMQMALDMALTGSDVEPWYAWIVVECNTPYATAIYTPSAAVIASGKEKLRKALSVIRQSQESGSYPAYGGLQVVHVPKWRENELSELGQEY